MKLTALLERMGLLVTVPVATPARAGAEPQQFETRIVTLAELRQQGTVSAGSTANEVTAVSDDLELSCEQVLEHACLPMPEHGWSVDTVAEVLRRPEFRDCSQDIRRQQLAVLLREHKVPPEDILADAHRRDEILDRYETQLVQKVADSQTDIRQRTEALRAQAQRLMQDAQAQERRISELDARLAEWRGRKREKEAHLEEIALSIGEKPTS